jgi:hypothetical protein
MSIHRVVALCATLAALCLPLQALALDALRGCVRILRLDSLAQKAKNETVPNETRKKLVIVKASLNDPAGVEEICGIVQC